MLQKVYFILCFPAQTQLVSWLFTSFASYPNLLPVTYVDCTLPALTFCLLSTLTELSLILLYHAWNHQPLLWEIKLGVAPGSSQKWSPDPCTGVITSWIKRAPLDFICCCSPMPTSKQPGVKWIHQKKSCHAQKHINHIKMDRNYCYDCRFLAPFLKLVTTFIMKRFAFQLKRCFNKYKGDRLS